MPRKLKSGKFEKCENCEEDLSDSNRSDSWPTYCDECGHECDEGSSVSKKELLKLNKILNKGE